MYIGLNKQTNKQSRSHAGLDICYMLVWWSLFFFCPGTTETVHTTCTVAWTNKQTEQAPRRVRYLLHVSVMITFLLHTFDQWTSPREVNWFDIAILLLVMRTAFCCAVTSERRIAMPNTSKRGSIYMDLIISYTHCTKAIIQYINGFDKKNKQQQWPILDG